MPSLMKGKEQCYQVKHSSWEKSSWKKVLENSVNNYVITKLYQILLKYVWKFNKYLEIQLDLGIL